MFSNQMLTRLIKRKSLQQIQPRNIFEQGRLLISSPNIQTYNDNVSRLSTRSLSPSSDVAGRYRLSTLGSRKSDVKHALPSIQRNWRGKEPITVSVSSLHH